MIQEFLTGTGNILIYFILLASISFICRLLFTIPEELFRKILHFILLGSFLVFLTSFETWWIAVIIAILFEIIVYPILKFFERFKGYSTLTTERKKGELKNSLLLVFTMFALVISICWGGLGMIAYIIISLIVAFISAMTELYSKNGNDTIICPLSAMITLIPLVYLFGGL